MHRGCGRFGDSEWNTYLLKPVADQHLAKHIVTCAQCRADAEGLRRTASALRHVSSDHEAVRQTFSRAVLADYMSQRSSSSTTETSTRTGGFLHRLQRRWSVPMAWAAAASLLLVVASFNGWMPWSPTTEAPMVSTLYGHATDDAAPELLAAGDVGPQLMLLEAGDVAATVTTSNGLTHTTVQLDHQAVVAAVPLHQGHGVTQAVVAVQ